MSGRRTSILHSVFDRLMKNERSNDLLRRLSQGYLRKSGYSETRFRVTGYPVTESTEEIYADLYPKESLELRRFYNLGAGSFRHRFWTNVDHRSAVYSKIRIDIDFDMTKNQRLDIEDSIAELVYSSHCIEHIWDDNVENLFREIYRVLKSDGVIRITCPDAELYVKAYEARDMLFFRRLGWSSSIVQSAEQALIGSCAAQYLFGDVVPIMSDQEIKDIVALEPTIYDALTRFSSLCSRERQNEVPGNHVNWWTEKKVEKFLRVAGFKKIKRSRYGQSSALVMQDIRYFDLSHPHMSLYMEAVK